MHLNIEFGGEVFEASGESPVDLSIPIREKGGASAWYVDDMKVEVVRSNGFLGSVAEGGAVNFRNVTFNPHGNGTHTECLGHISPEAHSVNEVLIPAIMPCLLITVTPEKHSTGTASFHAISCKRNAETIGIPKNRCRLPLSCALFPIRQPKSPAIGPIPIQLISKLLQLPGLLKKALTIG